ncbi:hypothetical protein AWM79_15215 [Pseudomonas agarici]|uniref:Uncharacterized protein n=1 Tax=Pseudomonas agarici TaxID=46677 RepID=A0A0X1T3Y0_PSEAA|nr:ankyrin repeat domain-containing protein [Pseudomonas agarici]AMB86579.1 hypothetical protein AWM79_15215 [Pseudomonas agarici]SEL49399.1 hypothetical protein SAMN05216604_12020 [Pseudomonas agarici]
MNRIGPRSTPTQYGHDSNKLPLHTAVENNNEQLIRQLRNAGARANTLDEAGHSPLDVLDSKRDIDQRSRSGLRMALLQSLNPTAPLGYMKPEAIHGSPWGLEILQSQALIGGVTDQKGGSESLEGKVFFSDRTRESTGDQTTRKGFRSKPRIYAAGQGEKSSNAYSRAEQHRLTQVMLTALKAGIPLQTNAPGVRIDVANLGHMSDEECTTWLQTFLHKKHIYGNGGKKFITAPLNQHIHELQMPASVTLRSGEQSRVIQGPELMQFYRRAARVLQHSLENGKAPYLGMLNQGRIVPVVFGFEKIKNLASHSLRSGFSQKINSYSYQNEAHPLSGSAKGGKLKEIEVRDLPDLATLCLGCAAKGIALPKGVVVRIKAHKQVKAQYLAPQKVERFQNTVLHSAAQLTGARDLSKEGLERLQAVNAHLRSSDLMSYF